MEHAGISAADWGIVGGRFRAVEVTGVVEASRMADVWLWPLYFENFFFLT